MKTHKPPASQTSTSEQEALNSHIKEQLNLQSRNVGEDISVKLDNIRTQALVMDSVEPTEISKSASLLNKKSKKIQFKNIFWKTLFAPTLAIGFALVIFINIGNTPSEIPTLNTTSSDFFSDIDILLSNEDLELMEEDLEFYLWLEKELETG